MNTGRREFLAPDGVLTGRTAVAASATTVDLQRRRHSTDDLDARFSGLVRSARDNDAGVRFRLSALRQEIDAGIAALSTSLDTPAGRQQIVDLLERKAATAQAIIAEAHERSAQAALGVRRVGRGYDALHADGDAAGADSAPRGMSPSGSRDGSGADDSTTSMLSWGPRPLSPSDDPPGPPPSPSATLPAPLRDFGDYQAHGVPVPPWSPPPPPQTGEPIKLPPAAPRPPIVITLEPPPVDLFPNCDNGDVVKAFGQLAGGGIGAAVAATTGPLTAGVTWAGLGVAAITIADAADTIATCKGIS